MSTKVQYKWLTQRLTLCFSTRPQKSALSKKVEILHFFHGIDENNHFICSRIALEMRQQTQVYFRGLPAVKKTSFLVGISNKYSHFLFCQSFRVKYPEKVAKILCNLHVIVLMLLNSVKCKRKIFVAFSENLNFTDL